MGCGSSSLGGNYPGQRPSNDAGTNTHHVQHGGGNTMVYANNTTNTTTAYLQPQQQSNLVSVTVPLGVKSGDKIQVNAPDGRKNVVTVPSGMSAGSTFEVKFADGAKPQEEEPEIDFSSFYDDAPMATSELVTDTNTNTNNNTKKNDFASGF